MEIYEDNSRKRVAHKQLFENRTYYIDFEDAKNEQIISSIRDSKLYDFINWQSGNKFGTLNITNYIGNIYFFGNTYDVRSQKFLTDLSGAKQFQTILGDILELSKNIIFTYSSPSFVLRHVNYKDANPSLLLVFNYLKQIVLDRNHSTNLQSSIQRITSNPNFTYSTEYKTDRTEKINKIDSKSLKSLVNNNKYYVKVGDDRLDIINLPVTRFVSQNSPHNYFPCKSMMKKKYLCLDTPENRFVKYFIEHIESIAYKLNAINNLPDTITNEKDRVLSFCRTTLNSPFFKHIGRMSILPIHSPVLHGRPGYKDILSHYTLSRFGVKHIFEDFKHEAQSIDLKRISELYEYWVFYKIAIAFLGNNINIEQQDVVITNGDISYGLCFKNKTTSVFFNRTESRSLKTAYSVTLRPDTTVIVNTGGKILKFIFDAKYKVRTKNNEDGIERHVKSEDIYKMHAYLDAIEGCLFSVAVYPGTEFFFYEKNINLPTRRTVDSVETFEGVGAIPLVPNDNALNSQFLSFIETIKNKYNF